MNAKEKVNNLLTQLNKVTPYVKKALGAVKTTSLKVSQKAAPLIQQGFSKVKTGVDAQIKNYQAKKDSAKQNSATTETTKPDTNDQTPKA